MSRRSRTHPLILAAALVFLMLTLIPLVVGGGVAVWYVYDEVVVLPRERERAAYHTKWWLAKEGWDTSSGDRQAEVERIERECQEKFGQHPSAFANLRSR